MSAQSGIIAFVGLGRMGLPMATNLADAGFRVIVYNRTRDVAEKLAQHPMVTIADTPKSAASDAQVVITMLSDEQALRTVYEGSDGLIAGWTPGEIAIDMGTTGPSGTSWLSQLVREAGGILIDAPVSGSTAAAQARTLTLMVGGPAEDLKKVHAVLEALGSNIYHLGATGSGAAMKLAVNAIIYALGEAVSESLVLAERAGIPRSLAYEVFCNSAVAAPMVKYRAQNFIEPETCPVSFALRLAEKDLRLTTALADRLGAPMPQAKLNLQVIEEAVKAGLAEQDMAAIAVHLRTKAAATEHREGAL